MITTSPHSEPKTKEPIFRKANSEDFSALYTIWMQDHVNRYMSFEILSKEEFWPIFENFLCEGDIFVLEVDKEIVASRRAIYGKGKYEHIAALASFGVHVEHLGKGYGKSMLQYITDVITQEKPYIKRLEIIQADDNKIASTLAIKQGFKFEAMLPDWAIRTTGSYKDRWYVNDKFMVYFLDTKLPTLSRPALLTFEPQLPPLLLCKEKYLNKVCIDEKQQHFICSENNKVVAACEIRYGTRRGCHLQFWSLTIEGNCEEEVLQYFLRELVIKAAKASKKVEIITHDNSTLKLMATLGFHQRGKKIASFKENDNYYDEIYADLSLFDINDAMYFMSKTDKIDDYQKIRLTKGLVRWRAIIEEAYNQNEIDSFGSLYLKNLAYQMVTDTFREMPYYTKDDAPWEKLILQLPAKLMAGISVLGMPLGLNVITQVKDLEKPSLYKSNDHISYKIK